MGKSLKWDITYKCNLNCAHCLNGDFLHQTEDELNLDEIKKIIGHLKSNDINYVHLLGGEPTAREDILEIFDEFENKNLDFGFNTNGLKLKNPEYRARIMNNKSLKNIIFSLEGPIESVNDAIRGKKVFSITVANLKEIISIKKNNNRDDIDITINMVASKSNIQYIIDMIYFCIGLGVDELVLLQFIPEGNGKMNNQSLSLEEELWLIKEISKIYTNIKKDIRLTPKFAWPLTRKYVDLVLNKEFPETTALCGAGNSFFYLNNKGELFPCDRCRDDIYASINRDEINLVNNNFWEIASIDSYGKIFEKTEGSNYYKILTPCNECQFLRVSCFPCVAKMEVPYKTENRLCNRMMEEIKNVSNK